MSTDRRQFFQILGATGVAAQTRVEPQTVRPVQYPRVFNGRQLQMIAFPLGGVGSGSVSLGGRGQLRDWEIFNKPDKGNSLAYALPSIWVQAGTKTPVARVLEARFQPPYEGQNGLGSQNAPGLRRLTSARFTGEYPLAHIDFSDRTLPVEVSLNAHSVFIPHDAYSSGLPVAILRYHVTNPGPDAAKVSIAWSIENPVGAATGGGAARPKVDQRRAEFRKSGELQGLLMDQPGLDQSHPTWGTFALGVLGARDGSLTHLRGWPRGRWWNSPMLFWDDFSADGEVTETAEMGPVGCVCLQRTLAPRAKVEFTFVLAWHFPNRTPERCGWSAPPGHQKTVIGNWYTREWKDAWAVAEHYASRHEELDRLTNLFAEEMRQTTLPSAVKEAASANLSTLATTTCFRTGDGEFHGFEGVNDKSGCCFGNCTHVWNYETATAHLFPTLSRSLRSAAFGYSLDDAGAIHFRQLLPDGLRRSGYGAADGQMGQILHAYLDWILSGDRTWLRNMWPRIRKALEFAWVQGGWDGDRDGVMEGVQHNTYDVEFYGPNPQCGIYYLGALRAGEEMARAVGDNDSAKEYRRLFDSGSKWIDANLFNGEFYVQKVRGVHKDQIAPALMSNMGSENTESPEYQVGGGCLVDQLVGQYLADVCGLGPLVQNVDKTLASIYRYNRKTDLFDHDSVQRIFAVNDESALVICDYGKAPRPRIPFPYYAEVMTGFEYSAATHMLFAGMTREGVECIRAIRARYDGERRNPWDEAECGHHYARAMAAWSGLLAMSGFSWHGGEERITVNPTTTAPAFRSFWSTATGWGSFKRTATSLDIKVEHGKLPVRSVEWKHAKGKVTQSKSLPVTLQVGETLSLRVSTAAAPPARDSSKA